jgi:hypothetical protein
VFFQHGRDPLDDVVVARDEQRSSSAVFLHQIVESFLRGVSFGGILVEEVLRVAGVFVLANLESQTKFMCTRVLQKKMEAIVIG